MEWIRRYHRDVGKPACTASDKRLAAERVCTQTRFRLVTALFETAGAMRDMPWEVVEAVMLEYHVVLEGIEPGLERLSHRIVLGQAGSKRCRMVHFCREDRASSIARRFELQYYVAARASRANGFCYLNPERMRSW